MLFCQICNINPLLKSEPSVFKQNTFPLQRGDTALDRAKSDTIREILSTAITLHKELNIVKATPIVRPVPPLTNPKSTFKPACDANFKVFIFIPG